MLRTRWSLLLAATLLTSTALLAVADEAEPNPSLKVEGFLPIGADGKPLNFDFETGTLDDWRAEGEAFAGLPIEGDTVRARRANMHSRHQGEYWIGTSEVRREEARGTLTSVPFKVTHPYASFLVGGGPHLQTRVEVVRDDTQEVLFRASGDGTEEMKRVLVDLTGQLGQTAVVRVVDDHSGLLGHINFDDFRFHEARPAFTPRRAAPAPDVFVRSGLDPEAAARAMDVPEGFRVSLFAGEPDVVQPIAFCLDDRGRLWVAEAYSYPILVAADQAKDRILIFEDTDGDGRFDERTVFADKLNLVSGLEVGFGGVWVGASPNLMFIPDQDGDDRPDGPPQVLLDGWGQQDTHETLNSFIWGPDGWLYGCQGVFTQSRVGKPGTPEAERVQINAGIWRYHPTKHVFEVFAHGTSNSWGVDFDDRGQAVLTACVIPHLYHVIQGARYERQAGPHFNPYTYDDIKTIADHRHWVGSNPHAGNGRSAEAGGGHAHSGAMIYLGGTWPKEYRGSIFMNNIHGARLNRDTLTPNGSGFVGGHAPDFLMANDSWSQIVSLRYGPDGNVYMIDWYDKNQCHHTESEFHDRTNGRIFKVSYGEAKREKVDLKKSSDEDLVRLLGSPNDWHARHARRILQERGVKPAVRTALATMAFGESRGPGVVGAGPVPSLPEELDEPHRLRALWTLHATGGLQEDDVARGLASNIPTVRAWTIQLAMEDGRPSPATLAKFADLAEADPSPVVRLYLASALQRLPLERRWEVLAGLLRHGEDAGDHNLPLMYWYAAEPLAAADTGRAAGLVAKAKIPLVQSFLARRIGAIGTPEAIALLVEQVARAEGSETQLTLLQALVEALKGRRRVPMPATWKDVARRLDRGDDPQVRSLGRMLGVTFGEPRALEEMRSVLADASAPRDRRLEALDSLRRAQDPELPPLLYRMLDQPDLRGAALRALAAYEDPAAPTEILKVYKGLTPAERRDATNTLAARVGSARALLEAAAAGAVPRADLSADLIRQLRNLKDPGLDAQIAEVWGAVRESTEDKAKLIARYKAMVKRPYAGPPDPVLGRAVFARTCQQCHTLFSVGGNVGPELTGSNRADLDYVLMNVLDPSALIGKDYMAQVIATTDGRVLTGIVRAEDKDAITLVTANETLTLPMGDVEERRPSEQSMMPEDIWANLSEGEFRGLVAYLASPSQVPMLATPENIAGLFNGRDLTGWSGDPALWSVEDGQIVGKTAGLATNAFLINALAAGDFRLTFQVKLVGNEGNSGLQFRSEAMPEGEVKGYQADVGPGWWGKLYEENGRGMLWDRSGEDYVRPGDWNTYEIVAVGPRIRTYLNGKECVDLDDPQGARRGVFALQLHSGGPTEVRFKDLKLELDPKVTD